MDSSKRAIKFQYFDSKIDLTKFWAVLIIVDICAYFLNIYSSEYVFIGVSDVGSFSLMGMNIMAILIYFIAYSYEIYYVKFPIAISFSMTRKDFFKSLMVDNILVALVFSSIQGVFMKIDPILVKSMGRNPIYNFGFLNTKTDNLLSIIFSLFITSLILIAIWNLLASVNYRFGYKIWIVAGIIALLIISLGRYDFVTKIMGVFSSIYSGLGSITNKFALFSMGMLIIMISYVLGYLLIKKLSIKR